MVTSQPASLVTYSTLLPAGKGVFEVKEVVPPERISRFLSYLLRHRPKEYSIDLDRNGFAAWIEVVAVTQERFPEASEDEIRAVVEGAAKRRFEIQADKVRATYGHSFAVDLGLEAIEPPAELYLGTARDLAHSIVNEGLKPRDRRYVHLSGSIEEALAVGKRRDPLPAIVVVDASTAYSEGVRFYHSGPLFLADEVPARYLSLR